MLPSAMANMTLLSNNTTILNDRPRNSVSWQSAFWPLVACALAVMLQNTGRVCGGHYRDSCALRSSPFVCIVDTFFMLVTFLALLVVGCSFRVAAMHVWYDRFEPERSDFKDTFGILYSVFTGARPKQSTTNLSISADDTRVTVLPPVAEVDQEEAYAPSDTVDIPLQLFFTSGNLPPPTAEEHDKGPEVDIGELQFTALAANGAVSESIGDNNGNRDLEMGLDMDGVLEDDPLLSPAQRPRTHLGSGIDRAWRLNMAAFMLGVVPQTIKIFGMRGIPLTQTLVAFYMISFLVPELFRAVAGPAGAVDLYPMPIVSRVKKLIHYWQLVGLILASLFGWMFSHNYLLFYLSFNLREDHVWVWHKWPVVLALSAFLAFPINGIVTTLIQQLLCLLSECLSQITRFSDSLRSKVYNSLAKLAKLRAALIALVGARSPESGEGFFVLFAVCFPASFIATFFLERCLQEGWDAVDHSRRQRDDLIVIMSSLWTEPALLLLSYDLFSIMFIGSLSKYPRRLFGLEGTFHEFATGSYVLFNFAFAIIGYAFCKDFAANTFKPSWAEYLG
ncbi:hypothetical protein DE146DRAFT_788327 [Phaeosphaeria sp. MPI-PUGE-AT-0046c]|nr:hypothetical protein DE146DRAFT_788327 [Phaeosphaeria sp. MPI-PUGE-AT-0046c]